MVDNINQSTLNNPRNPPAAAHELINRVLRSVIPMYQPYQDTYKAARDISKIVIRERLELARKIYGIVTHLEYRMDRECFAALRVELENEGILLEQVETYL